MYGIRCISGHRAERLSAEGGRVARLVRACNEGALSEEHFWDVVEDFLRDPGRWAEETEEAAPAAFDPILQDGPGKR